MRKTHEIMDSLKNRNYRYSEVREAILHILNDGHKSLSAPDILRELRSVGLSPNKTTVYRELDTLLKENIIQELQFDEQKKRYELVSDEHHHHLICTECGQVREVVMDDLYEKEKEIAQSLGFEVIRHSLEFYGLCKKCK